MAANTIPIFVREGAHSSVIINDSNAAADGSGTLFTLITGHANGTRLEGIIFTSSQVAQGASSARVMRIFLTDDVGQNPVIIGEQQMPAVTRSNTVPGPYQIFMFPQPLLLRPGQQIKISQTVRATANDDTSAVALAANY